MARITAYADSRQAPQAGKQAEKLAKKANTHLYRSYKVANYREDLPSCNHETRLPYCLDDYSLEGAGDTGDVVGILLLEQYVRRPEGKRVLSELHL